MTTQPDDSTALTPKAAGILTRAVRALIKTDPKGAAELVQDASVDALSKADSSLLTGDDTGYPGVIRDLWDGPPDAHLSVQTAAGPGSSVSPGNVGVGPGQEMSGGGAPRMQATYSRPAAQSGVQNATEILGRDLIGMRKAMQALLDVAKVQSLQMETMKATMPVMPSAEDIATMISEGIAKALPDALKGAMEGLNKADDKKDDKDDDDKKDKNPFAKAEVEDGEKAAAFVASARAELSKATEAALDDRPKAAARHRETVAIALEDAKPLLAKATEETRTLYERIVKAMPAAQSENQDTWPTAEPKGVGKAEESQGPDLKAATEAIGKAAEGIGMLTANVNQVLNAIGNSSRNPQGLPPVFSLAKAQPSDVDARMLKIQALAEAQEITWQDVDATKDAVQRLRMASVGAGMPPAWAQQALQRLPDKVQAILRDAAA
jgi:hypothetical protein